MSDRRWERVEGKWQRTADAPGCAVLVIAAGLAMIGLVLKVAAFAAIVAGVFYLFGWRP